MKRRDFLLFGSILSTNIASACHYSSVGSNSSIPSAKNGQVDNTFSQENNSPMANFDFIQIRQPQIYDIVNIPIKVCGVATGFEGVIQYRLRDEQGKELKASLFNVGSNGVFQEFLAEIPLETKPQSALGILEVFEINPGTGNEDHKVVIPLVFGSVLINDYYGFSLYTVKVGDTLAKIAQQAYGEVNLSSKIFQANRDRLLNPNIVTPGQILRIPLGSNSRPLF
ncbi:MAG: LysM peptidoglycan-binding domain-containing protein [Cyanobacteria bacterium J149]|nr:MAG: LysM peptidoglycan-binding domain-containing protein [Cyanobacteria bacterium J149]